MLATSCWRPHTYASARGCVTVMQRPLVTLLRFSVLLVARRLHAWANKRYCPCSSAYVLFYTGFVVAEGY